MGELAQYRRDALVVRENIPTGYLVAHRTADAVLALLDRLEAAEAAVDRVRRRHPRGDEEPGPLAPGLWCPTCGRERSDNGYGGCPDRAALAQPDAVREGAGS